MSRRRSVLLVVVALLTAVAVWREIRWKPGRRTRAALALYAPGVQVGERVGALAARWPGLTLAAYEGLRDSAFATRDSFADLYLLVEGMQDDYTERAPAAGARVRGLKLRTTSAAGTRAAVRHLTDRLGEPRVQCWGADQRPVLSWRDFGGGGVALSLLPNEPVAVAGHDQPHALLIVVAHGLASELRFASDCGTAAHVARPEGTSKLSGAPGRPADPR